MFFKTGFGKSKRKNPNTAGKEAFDRAVELLSDTPQILIVYATANYDQKALLEAIGERNLSQCPVVGCSGEGIIDGEESYEGNFVVGILALASDTVRFTPFFIADINKDGAESGTKLAKQLNDLKITDAKALILYPDGLRSNCSQLLSSLSAGLEHKLPMFGGTSGDSFQFEQSFQYFGTEPLVNGLSGFVLSGDIEIDFIVSHGCSPIGMPVEVTKASGNVLIELNNKPAADALLEYFEIDSANKENIVQGGIGEKIEDTDLALEYESDYIMRAPMRVNADRSINMAAEITVGSKVLYHRRDPQEIASRSKKAFMKMLERHAGELPHAILQFDCGGRGKTLFKNETTANIVTPLTSCFNGSKIPWFGFHSFGEIAPVKDTNLFHSYTVVLCVIYPKSKPLKKAG